MQELASFISCDVISCRRTTKIHPKSVFIGSSQPITHRLSVDVAVDSDKSLVAERKKRFIIVYQCTPAKHWKYGGKALVWNATSGDYRNFSVSLVYFQDRN